MILVDDRAGSCELIAPLQALGLTVESTRLSAGDVAFEGKGPAGKPVLVGIEYKKIPDFISSCRTQRLQDIQLPRMREEYDNCWLFLEGELLYDSHGRLLRRARKTVKPLEGGMGVGELLKRIFVFHLCGGLTPWWTKDQKDTVTSIHMLYRTWTDQALDKHRSHLGSYQAPALVPLSDFRAAVMKFPGVGHKASLAVEETFSGSLECAILAGIDVWANIVTTDDQGKTRKLGKATAQRIKDFLKGKG